MRGRGRLVADLELGIILDAMGAGDAYLRETARRARQMKAPDRRRIPAQLSTGTPQEIVAKYVREYEGLNCLIPVALAFSAPCDLGNDEEEDNNESLL